MSLQSAPYCWIECDREGCSETTGQVITIDGVERHYCDAHYVSQCRECGEPWSYDKLAFWYCTECAS